MWQRDKKDGITDGRELVARYGARFLRIVIEETTSGLAGMGMVRIMRIGREEVESCRFLRG
jgi:hypothetical protein